MSESLFRQESLEKMKKTEETDEYLKVINPSFWLVIIAALVLGASFTYWAFAGTVPNRIESIGIVKNEQVTVLMPEKEVEAMGDSLEVLIDGRTHSVTGVEGQLLSPKKVKQIYGKELNPTGMSIVVKAEAKGVPDGIKTMAVVTNRVRVFEYMRQQNSEVNNEQK